MILVLSSLTGGSGLTTMATNLAVIRANEGKDVLLIDGGELEMASRLTRTREAKLGVAGYTVTKLADVALREQANQLKGKYSDIVIDLSARNLSRQRDTLSVADLFLVPFTPDAIDIGTVDPTTNLAIEIGKINPELRAFTFLNLVGSRENRNAEIETAIKERGHISFIDAPIRNRKAFRTASALGLSVVELEPSDPTASSEIMALYNSVFLKRLFS